MKNWRIGVRFKGNCLKPEKVTFTLRNVVNLFIAYELDAWSRDLSANFTLKDYLFGAFKLTRNADPGKYSYSWYGIGFDSCSLFLLINFDWGKTVVVFRVDNSSSLLMMIRKKILIISEGLTQRLDDIMVTAEAKYSINSTRLN